MAAFPLPDWQVQDITEMALYNLSTTPTLSAAICARIAGGPGFVGRRRIVVGGAILMQHQIPLSCVLPGASALGHALHLSISPADAMPREGFATSEWFDVETMVKQRELPLVDMAGNVLDATELLRHLRSDCAEKEAVGAALRFGVVAGTSGRLELELQCLPCPVKFLKPIHQADNTPTIRLSGSALAVDMFDGSSHSGPVPVFFAADPDTVQQQLVADRDAAHDIVTMINNIFIIPEHFSYEEAVTFLKKKPRAGKGVPAYGQQLPASKRARNAASQPPAAATVQQLAQETGTSL